MSGPYKISVFQDREQTAEFWADDLEDAGAIARVWTDGCRDLCDLTVTVYDKEGRPAMLIVQRMKRTEGKTDE